MRYLIVGCGRVGSTLAKRLARAGHEVTVVDENSASFRRVGRDFPGKLVLGTGIDVDVLRRAGAETADGFAAVTQGDNRNIMAALIAQQHFKIKRVVARIYDPMRSEMYREFGISPYAPRRSALALSPERSSRSTISRCCSTALTWRSSSTRWARTGWAAPSRMSRSPARVRSRSSFADSAASSRLTICSSKAAIMSLRPWVRISWKNIANYFPAP